MITYGKLGHSNRGRLGNQLFQIASTIGLAYKFGHTYAFPKWEYDKFLLLPLPTFTGRWELNELKEKSFAWQEEKLQDGENYSLDGWRQSEKYFADIRCQLRDLLSFTADFERETMVANAEALSRPCVAISVRRGDFVGNPNYAQIPARYYLLGLFEDIPNWQDYNIIVFSDDCHYCQVQFEGLPNVYFAEGSAIEQLCLMTFCRHFIISNSTFSWWGAWLGEREGSIVVRPPINFAGELAKKNSEKDYWPERWKVCDYRNRKLDLSDVTFTIPVFFDHRHRRENLELCYQYLLEDFNTNILIGEQGERKIQKAQGCKYFHFDLKHFHRTKMLNDMAKMSKTPIVVNWDCDVFVPAAQVYLAAARIREGADMVYPFDGRFARVPRVWYDKLRESRDVGVFGNTEFKGKHGKKLPTTSVGGAIMFNRESFLQGGGENEFMVSFGPEDWERNFRFSALGYQVERVPGCLYHLDHFVGTNSSNRNPYFKVNHKELTEMRKLNPEQLAAYVAAWPWRE